MNNPDKPSILAFAGSTRKQSFNGKLLRVAADSARQAGATVTLLDLADYPMPIFNEDLEAAEGLPDSVKAFKQVMSEHDGLLIASPEYNGCITALLKNALDWASRAETPEEPPLSAYRNKLACLLSASPGGLGGLRGLLILRMLLNNLGVNVLASQRALSTAHQAFDENGGLRDAKQQAGIDGLAAEFTRTLEKLTRS